MTMLADETAKFNRWSEDWWQPSGSMAMLHAMHPTRMAFIVAQLQQAGLDDYAALRALDIGCGGGITAENLARLGMEVSGLDAAQELLDVARDHAAGQGLRIDYRQGDLISVCDTLGQYDLVCALEVIEHVDDVSAFLAAAESCVAPGGLLIISTINRTLKSRLLAIGLAEYALRLLPIGTHQWKKFVKPSEIVQALPQARLVGLSGMLPCPDLHDWRLVPQRVAVNYIMALRL